MIRLEPVSGENLSAVIGLKVAEEQRRFVAPNDVSIMEAYLALSHNGHAFPFAILAEERPVGFCMVGFGVDDDWTDAPAAAADSYSIWRLMIDAGHQGRGCGREAMEKILDFIRTWPCGSAESCWVSYLPENTAAKALYASFGFRETGETDGDEVIAVLPLGAVSAGEDPARDGTGNGSGRPETARERLPRKEGLRKLQLGMPTLVENQTLQENVDLCVRLGLRFIELNMNFPEYQMDRLEGTDALLRAAEAAGIYYTVHLDENLDPADFNPLVSRAWLETVRRTILAARRLVPLRDRFGDPAQPLTLNMHMNHGVHITLPDRKVQMYERDFSRYLAACRDFRDRCEEWIGEAPLRIVLENTDGFRSFEREAIALYLESPCFGLTWDIGHSKADGERDEAFLRAHADRLLHFHIHDGTERPPRNHLALGDGEIDLPDRLRLAEKLGCRCVLETKTAAALETSVRWLKEHFL